MKLFLLCSLTDVKRQFSKTLFLTFSSLIIGNLPAQNWEWAIQSFGQTGDVTGNMVTSDNLGNVFVNGQSAGDAWLGKNAIHQGQFIARYSSDGNLQWVKNIEPVRNIIADNLGGFYTLSGYYSYPNNFLTLTRFDGNGNVVWERKGNFNVSDAVCDGDGNIYLACNANMDTIDFNGVKSFLPTNNWSIFLVQSVGPDGNIRWQSRGLQTNDTIGFIEAGRIVLNHNNQVVVLADGLFPRNTLAVGYFSKEGIMQKYHAADITLDFHYGYPYFVIDQKNNFYLTNPTEWGQVSKFDTAFKHIKNITIGDAGQAYRNSLSFGTGNKMLLVARFYNKAPFYDYCGISVPTRGEYNSGIHIYRDELSCQAFFTSNGMGNDRINDYTVDQSGSVYVTGDFQNIVADPQGQPLSYGKSVMENDGSHSDMFVYKISSITTGLNETISTEKNIELFPNPASVFVTVDGLEGTFEAELFSTCGQKVNVLKPDERCRLDISEVPPGVYILRCSGNNSVRTTRLLVNK